MKNTLCNRIWQKAGSDPEINLAKCLIDKGVDLVTVKHLMGHKRLASNARYTKPSKRDLRVAVSSLEPEEL